MVCLTSRTHGASNEGCIAGRGLLVRGGDVLEATSHVDTVIFDKTGTLTQGRPRVQSVLPASPQLGAQQLLALAAALERESSHPLAAAITHAAEQAGQPCTILPFIIQEDEGFQADVGYA